MQISVYIFLQNELSGKKIPCFYLHPCRDLGSSRSKKGPYTCSGKELRFLHVEKVFDFSKLDKNKCPFSESGYIFLQNPWT